MLRDWTLETGYLDAVLYTQLCGDYLKKNNTRIPIQQRPYLQLVNKNSSLQIPPAEGRTPDMFFFQDRRSAHVVMFTPD